jgi:hypothetical protein
MRLVHELLWNDWIRGSLEQQHADILLYSLDVSTSIEHVLSRWIEKLPVLAFGSHFRCTGGAIAFRQ